MRGLAANFREHVGLVRSSIGLYATQTIGLAAGLFTNVLVCRTLGVSRQGRFYMIITLAMLLRGFGSLGVETVLTAYSAREDVPAAQLNGLALFYCVFLGSVLALAGAGFQGLFPSVLPEGYWAVGLLAPMLLFQSCFSALATGRHDIHFFNAFQVIGPFLNLLAVLFLHFTGRTSVGAFALGFVTSNAMGVFLMAALLWLRRQGFALPVGLGAVRQLLRIGLGGYVAGLLSAVRDRYNVFLVAGFGGFGAVGLYSVAWTLVEKIWMGADSLALVLTKRLAAATEWEAGRAVRRIVTALAVPLAAALGFAVAAGCVLIPAIWGEQYRGAVPVFAVAAFSFVFYFPSRLLAVIVSYTRLRPDLTAKLGGISLAVTAPIAYWLNFRFGLLGAAVTTIVQAAAIFATLWAAVYPRRSPFFPKPRLKPPGNPD